MKTRPKDQGTAFETWLVGRFNESPTLGSSRLAEGGNKDLGDIWLRSYKDSDESWDMGYWIIEARARANTNPHRWMADAKQKHNPNGFPKALIHKRLVRKEGNQRRTPDGEPIVVYLDLDTFIRLLGGNP